MPSTTQGYLDKAFLGKKENWLTKEMGLMRFKTMIIKYNQLRLKRGRNRLEKEDYKELAELYRPDIQDKIFAEKKLRSILKIDKVKQFADEKLEKALEKNKVTKDWLIKQRKKVIEIAFEDKQLQAANKALDVLEEYSNMKGQQSTSTQTETIDYDEIDASITSPEQIGNEAPLQIGDGETE